MKLRGLYAITDSQLLAGKCLKYVEAALDGGLTLLQYRDKSTDEARRLREAEALKHLCDRYKAHLLINDDAELAEQAVKEGATYVAFGRFFTSSTKPGAAPAALDVINQARARLVNVPICVIGGVTLDNAAPLVERGADLLAVVHGLFGADSTQEVTRRARAFNALLPI